MVTLSGSPKLLALSPPAVQATAGRWLPADGRGSKASKLATQTAMKELFRNFLEVSTANSMHRSVAHALSDECSIMADSTKISRRQHCRNLRFSSLLYPTGIAFLFCMWHAAISLLHCYTARCLTIRPLLVRPLGTLP